MLYVPVGPVHNEYEATSKYDVWRHGILALSVPKPDQTISFVGSILAIVDSSQEIAVNKFKWMYADRVKSLVHFDSPSWIRSHCFTGYRLSLDIESSVEYKIAGGRTKWTMPWVCPPINLSNSVFTARYSNHDRLRVNKAGGLCDDSKRRIDMLQSYRYQYAFISSVNAIFLS